MVQVEKLFTDSFVKNIGGTADNANVATRDMRRLIADVSTAVAEQRKQLAVLEASLQKSATGLERVTTGPELDRALKRLDTLGERMDTVTASLQRSSESVETVTGARRAGRGQPRQADDGRGALPQAQPDREQHERGDAEPEPARSRTSRRTRRNTSTSRCSRSPSRRKYLARGGTHASFAIGCSRTRPLEPPSQRAAAGGAALLYVTPVWRSEPIDDPRHALARGRGR